MHHTRLLTFGILAAVAGCGEPNSDPQPASAMITANIHIDGFRKSRSGAT